jgi:hypothetical protein
MDLPLHPRPRPRPHPHPRPRPRSHPRPRPRPHPHPHPHQTNKKERTMNISYRRHERALKKGENHNKMYMEKGKSANIPHTLHQYSFRPL